MKEDLLNTMQPSEYYQSINSVKVVWAKDLQYN
jgi:hypothetical protein